MNLPKWLLVSLSTSILASQVVTASTVAHHKTAHIVAQSAYQDKVWPLIDLSTKDKKLTVKALHELSLG